MSKAGSTSSRQLIPEIQGLRALAVTLVVLFHVWPTYLPGGFVGVDVFFVVSGYLITAHLLREVDATGRVAVTQFWARRIRRLLPASLLVLAVTGVLIAMLVPTSDWGRFFGHIVASTLYVENWALTREAADYWAQGASTPPTQHYWSLGVEEQFYIAWPLLFIILTATLGRRLLTRRRALLVGVGAVVFGSFIFSVWYTAQAPEAAYFSTFTRAWQFGAGGLLAFAPKLAGSAVTRTVVAWVGVAMIGGSALLLSESNSFPGYLAAWPTLGTVLVIVAGTGLRGASPSWLATLPGVGWLGGVSYAVYLWHWPLIVFAPRVVDTVTFESRVVIIALTLVLAWLTKVLVEDPVREAAVLRRSRSRPTYAAAVLATAVLVSGSLVAAGSYDRLVDRELDRAQEAVSSSDPCLGARSVGNPACEPTAPGNLTPSPDVLAQDFDEEIEACLVLDDSGRADRCTFGHQDAPTLRVALVGDSHAQAIAPAVREIAEREGWRLDVYLKTGCQWSDVVRPRPDNPAAAVRCSEWVDEVSTAVGGPTPDYDVVITTGFRVVANLAEPRPGLTPLETSVRGLQEAWATTSAKVIAIADNPDWPESSVTCLVDGGTAESCTEPGDVGFGTPDPLPLAAATAPGVSLIDFSGLYCPQGTCQSVLGGVPLYRDQHHLSGTFVATMTDLLADALVPLVAEAGASGRPSA